MTDTVASFRAPAALGHTYCDHKLNQDERTSERTQVSMTALGPLGHRQQSESKNEAEKDLLTAKSTENQANSARLSRQGGECRFHHGNLCTSSAFQRLVENAIVPALLARLLRQEARTTSA